MLGTDVKGDMASMWSVRVSGNWRVVFRFMFLDVEVASQQVEQVEECCMRKLLVIRFQAADWA